MRANRNLELTSEQEQEMLMELLECEHPLERINVYGQYGQLLRIEQLRKTLYGIKSITVDMEYGVEMNARIVSKLMYSWTGF